MGEPDPALEDLLQNYRKRRIREFFDISRDQSPAAVTESPFPTFRIKPDGKLPEGMIYYRDVSGKMRISWIKNTAGKQDVLEDNSAYILSSAQKTEKLIINGEPLTYDAGGGGTWTAEKVWYPFYTVVVADGAGNLATTQLVPAGAAGVKQDVCLWYQPNTTGAHFLNIVEETAGAQGPVVPAINFPAASHSLVAGMLYGGKYGLRCMNTTAAKNIGLNDGVACWPASAQIIFTGFYRGI